MRSFILPFIFCIFIVSCSNNNTSPTPNTDEITINQSPNYLKLQGSWQSREDANGYMVFEEDIVKDLYKGFGIIEAKFTLENRCLGGVGSTERDKDKYLNISDERCLYIVKLDTTYLELSNVDRGNTLSYRKVKL